MDILEGVVTLSTVGSKNIIFFPQEKLKAQGKMDKTKANEIFR